jgi:dTDP-4-dehydrorhamnose reductase
MKIVLTGATGLIGSRFFDLLKSKYEIASLSSSYGVDITDRKKVQSFLSDVNPAIIVHLAAKTNVDGCEEDKSDDVKHLTKEKILTDKEINFEKIDPLFWKGSTSAFGINVVGTKNLADYAREKDIKIIYISTDFIFDGEKDFYTEEDSPNPVDWYGQTKFWGELVLGERKLITRISFPFGYKSPIKNDLIWTLVKLLSTQESIKLVSDQIITPTFIDDIVNGLDFLIENSTEGIIDLVGNDSLAPIDIGVAIAREFGFNESKISPTTRRELYKGRAARPFKVALKNDKLKNLGFEMTDFFEALKKIKQ